MTDSQNKTLELKRQESINWKRGSHFSAYENVIGHYIFQSALEHIKPPNLLDIACGTGMLTNMLAPYFNRVVGLDASASIVTEAQEKYPNIEFFHALAEDYDTDEKFSTITIFLLLEHVINPEALLRVVAKKLSPDGVIIIDVPNALAVNRRIAKLMGTLQDEYELSPFDIDIAGHRRSYDMQTLTRDVEAAGLRVIARGGIFYKMLSTPQINWLLEKGPWEEGKFGWGRVGSEKEKDWRKAFCDACYEYGKSHPEDCNVIYIVAKL